MRIFVFILLLASILSLPTNVVAAGPCTAQTYSGRSSGTLSETFHIHKGQTVRATLTRLPFGYTPPDYLYFYLAGKLVAMTGIASVRGGTVSLVYTSLRGGLFTVTYRGIPAFLWSLSVECAP